jgi:hypothetical protein
VTSSDSNVYQLPISRRGDRRLSGSADAANALRARFRAGGRAQHETFIHLARQTFILVEELKEKFGERSGRMQLVFGNLLKQKKRFILAENEQPGVLCQNPANWELVLRGLAGALDRNADLLLLDVFRGSALLPGQLASGYRREQWLAKFQEMVVRMGDRLSAAADFAAISTYLADSGLVVEDGRLELLETQDGSVSIDEHCSYNPFVLSGMPHVLGLNFRTRVEQSYGCLNVDLAAVLERSGLDAAVAREETIAMLRVGTRSGLAWALGPRGCAEIAFIDWEVAELVFRQGDADEWAEPIFLSYEELGIAGDYTALPPPNSIQFHFVGSPGFDEAASAHIVFPERWADSPGYDLWDPGGYVDTVEQYPTDAPARTVGAVIERNLLYAAPDRLSDRIDMLLVKQLEGLKTLVDAHRSSANATIQTARAALLAEWDAAAPAHSKRTER